MWDLTLEELLSQGFINKQAYNICLKENLTTLYLINEFSKISSFTNIHRCGHTCAILLNSLCENYREAVNALNSSINIENLITFDTTIEQLFDANRFILLTYKTCAASGCETVEDIVIKLNSHPLLKRSRVGVRKELISVCEEAKSNRLIISLKYYERTHDYICQDILNDLVAEYHLTKESTIEELLKFNLISR